MHEISQDMPDHLKTRFSKVSNKPKHSQGKSYEPILLSGISPEAPDFFMIKNIPILTPSTRFEIISRLTTPKRPGKCNRNSSNYSNAGLLTGTTKHKGEFITPMPRITRFLSADEESLKRYLERSCKSRVKRQTKETKNKEELLLNKVSKVRPTTAKYENIDNIIIEPRVLSQRESRVLYNL